ncbi:MAG: murein L,D-transpeptidase family protein [Xanthobacteraceae bacterium]
MVHLSGSIELIRASLVRALTASAVLAGALALGGCYGDDAYQLPTRAMKELSPEMMALLEQKNMAKDSPILIRLFKEESELEVWKQDTAGRFELLRVYPICRWSGDLGPKVREGDRQAPEGFYAITPGLMNPNSNYYLAINIGFPNAYDKANGRTGAFLMIHGDCSSRGCYAMTDAQIGEIYSLARESFLGGQKAFQIQAYPFRMTPANLARHRNNPNMAFWKMIKEGNDHFEVSHSEPKIDVCERHYVFDAQQPANSTRPLVFNPTGPCPRFEVDPAIAGPAMDKQRNDEYQIAELTKANVPVAPLATATDGGMNRVFVAKLDSPTYTYDNEGHLHVPPLQPGRLPPAISAPGGSEPDTTAAVTAPAKDGNGLSNFFGGLFASKAAAEPTNVASADANSQGHSSFFGSLFTTKHDDAQQSNSTAGLRGSEQTANAAAAPPKLKPTTHNEAAAAAGLRPTPKVESHKTEPQEADAAKPKTTPQQQANAAAPAASNSGLINGAQPVMPAGTFDSRWGGLQ